jgi:hypothetical protein
MWRPLFSIPQVAHVKTIVFYIPQVAHVKTIVFYIIKWPIQHNVGWVFTFMKNLRILKIN